MKTIRDVRRRAVAESFVLAAEKVFGEKGYENTHMQDVAEEAGCAIGTLYLYFKSKDDFYSAMVTRHTNAIAEMLTVAFEQGKDPLDKLRRKTEAILSYFNDHKTFFRLFYTASPGGRAYVRSNLRDDALESYLDFKRKEEAVVRKGQAEGQFRDDISAAELVEFIHGVTISTLARWSAEDGETDPGEQLRLLWAFLYGGLGAR
ncbi:MAG: hypothetical protein AMXMBFR7_42910 [Planctomycetota bacterium]